MAFFHYFCRFAQICKKFAEFECKIVFVIVFRIILAAQLAKLFRNNNKNNFVSKCYKFLANLCKSSEILEHCHVKWWLKYRNNRSVSWRLSCNKIPFTTKRIMERCGIHHHRLSKFDWSVQLNLHETDLLFRYLSHHLT